MLCLFLFFKQKTAYEMRISDWSSDVCSSDLRAAATAALKRGLASFGRGNVSGALAAAQEATIADESWGLAHAFAARLHLAQGDGDAAEAEIARALRTGFAARRTRAEAGRVGKECGRKGRSRWSTAHSRKKSTTEKQHQDT